MCTIITVVSQSTTARATILPEYDLERMVSMEEVKRAVWDCGTDKSPGPDGFSFGFYRHFWPTIDNEVFEAVKYFFIHNNFPIGCNSAFIALIPKIPDANMVKDFRPISLIGSIYKIVAKILANRIVGVLDDIVNEVQSAFIAERQILDGPFILNEVMHWCKTKKKQALFFKVDFEKAYDTVRWDFLDDVLHKFGFGNKWRLWIQSCLRSSRGSIIVNGSPTEEFQFFKGLKQGDPLSPFLFILIMESLHLSFQRVVDAGMYTGIKLCSSLNLSHLFYADDVMFVGQWCDSNINTLVHALECFHRASGLKINMSKSKILGIHVEDVKVKQAASKLGCLILNTPFSYLGTKVGGSMSRVHAWDEVVEKVTSRLSRWKMKTLSIGGRLTLLKSVLGSMPIFHMSIFKVPSSVLQRLESIRSRFFKGHDLGSNKASWVKWSNVLTSKEKGGLGVSSLYALNRGLLFKWVWKFYAQKTSLWARVIKAIHGVDGKVGKAINSGASSCWTSIVREVEVLKQQGVNFFEYLQLNMGNGESTTFWEDRWLEGSVLKDIFPRLYVLETNKKVSVGDKLKDFRLDSSFHRKARGGIEQVQYKELSDMVNSISLTPKNDRYVWSLSNSGDVSVASFPKVIDENRYTGGRSRTRWVKYVPIKVNVTAWKIKMNALPTRLNISRRVDNSEFKLIVGHPNGTLAKITHVGNLKLNNDVVLFDVLVLPEYCVSLLSVHKLIKDSKLSVGFDETKCYVWDLIKEIVLRTRSESSGLYVFDKEYNKFATNNNSPYKVVSREGFSYFLTMVDDFSRLPSSVLNGKSHFSLVYGREPNLSHLRSFGCLCFAALIKESDKFSEKCVLIGYASGEKAYKVVSLENRNVIYSRDVKFYEIVFPCKIGSQNEVESSETDVTNLNLFYFVESKTIDKAPSSSPNDDEKEEASPGLRRSHRPSKLHVKLNEYVLDDKVKYGFHRYANLSFFSFENYCFVSNLNKSSNPSSFEEASKDVNWINAMNDEMHALYKDDTWYLTYLPVGRKPISSKWAFRIKYKSNGVIERYKARVIAKGYSQKNVLTMKKPLLLWLKWEM
ncbi:RNA-directed DNA polymerase, eukaryota [Tanacetum coccineum]